MPAAILTPAGHLGEERDDQQDQRRQRDQHQPVEEHVDREAPLGGELLVAVRALEELLVDHAALVGDPVGHAEERPGDRTGLDDDQHGDHERQEAVRLHRVPHSPRAHGAPVVVRAAFRATGHEGMARSGQPRRVRPVAQPNGSGSSCERDRLGAGGGHPAPVVLAAQHLVGDDQLVVLARRLVDVTDDDDLALDDHHAVLGAGVVGGPLAAPAQRLDLEHVHPVGQLDEAGAAGEQLAAEVGEDPEREHVDLELVDDLGQLVDLVAGVELRLVADQVVDPAARP